ncbi:hypothetical protein K488DRAFT_73161 [Vararia minispora EC-137]|uniref:Uncharacterized protein n=1 Tax=Vararia minispora EC-137 TaxID=1314806 RepID=A0ACB8QC69_9AGAM|nr:hypothetical protein K488DRAFT_73161 [Vararia minispora EC-137]
MWFSVAMMLYAAVPVTIMASTLEVMLTICRVYSHRSRKARGEDASRAISSAFGFQMLCSDTFPGADAPLLCGSQRAGVGCKWVRHCPILIYDVLSIGGIYICAYPSSQDSLLSLISTENPSLPERWDYGLPEQTVFHMCFCSQQLYDRHFSAPETSIIELALGSHASHARRIRFLRAHSSSFHENLNADANSSSPSCTSFLHWGLLGLPLGSLSLPHPSLLGMNTDDGWATQFDPYPHYILDALPSHPAHIIPMENYVPYANSTEARRNCELSRTDMLPVFFVRRDGGIGIPITSDTLLFNDLSNAHIPFGTPRTSTRVIIAWPGYAHIPAGQIQHNTTSGGGRVNISVGRAAKLVAGQVMAFMRRAEGRWQYDPSHRANDSQGRYRIGSLPSEITAEDVLLLGLVSVSRGAVMPLLQLREGFVFTPEL